MPDRIEDMKEQPFIGQGATYSIGGDSYPYTVQDMTTSGKTLWLSPDRARGSRVTASGTVLCLVDTESHSEVKKATLRKDGAYRWVGSGTGFIHLGERIYKRDQSF